MLDLTEAAREREERLIFAEVDNRIDLLLANGADHFKAVTANPRKMGYLRFLLRHYAKSATPWRDCVSDNTKRFGPEKVKGLCGVLKDVIRQSTHWRHGSPAGPHADVHDSGSPGVAIGQSDAWASPAWGGHHHLSEALTQEFGDFDVESLEEVADLLISLGEHCDVYRVLIGLDQPPTFTEEIAA